MIVSMHTCAVLGSLIVYAPDCAINVVNVIRCKVEKLAYANI